ncbi:hypothetical protein GT755_09815 [Herbidospora sp. NEAU-GS84]|uniref:Uncharacterized protein n=1 Tax=Herbidospora solisilvae TaxID=2696284 RepID=A0A7C9J2J7_9ACTN|nr:hypothetical protein [Herbidospora solisilvae]NAS21980.1 hypothetical protein [Herbidospora solisilvae]
MSRPRRFCPLRSPAPSPAPAEAGRRDSSRTVPCWWCSGTGCESCGGSGGQPDRIPGGGS